MAFSKPLTTTLGYGCFWAILFWAKLGQNSANDHSDNSEVCNVSEKYILLTLQRIQSQFQVVFLASNFGSEAMMARKHDLAVTVKGDFLGQRDLFNTQYAQVIKIEAYTAK